ncbi:MAG: hypothetical protein AAFV88_25985, partial [Planctomycetota bacterium]
MNEVLLEDVDRYCLAAGIEKITADQYRRSVQSFSAFLDRPAMRSDLNENSVNRWLEWVSKRRSACTALNQKRGLTPVWNWLAQLGAVAFYNPRALRKIKVAKGAPVAWSVAGVGQLLMAAGDLQGRLRCGVEASDLMIAWVRVAYETGMR